MKTSESPTSQSSITDAELVTAFREQPVARRTGSQVDEAARRFARATQERIAIKQRRTKLTSRLFVPALVVVALAVFAFGRWSASLRVDDNEQRVETVAPVVTIQPAPGAVFERVDSGPVHAARLHEGSIVVALDARQNPSAFVVVTGDAEVRGEGGLFEVVARADRLLMVRALDGRAAVRHIRGETLTVEAGAVYQAPHAAAVDPTGDPTGRAEARARINAALELLGAANFSDAADRFRVEAESPGSPFVEEATFWQAISLARAGKRDVARAKLEAFVARFPSSTHRLEALSVLGWLLVDASDKDAARRAFDEAKTSDDPRVRESAEDGLQRVNRR